MNLDYPTVAFTIGLLNSRDPAYDIYTEAYGLEMTIDNEWPVNTIIMSPPHLVSAMTRRASVTSMGVIAGASSPPADGNFAQISEVDGRWVLARPTDDVSQIRAAGLGVLLLIQDPKELAPVLKSGQFNETNFIVAIQTNSGTTSLGILGTAAQIRDLISEQNAASAQILVNGSLNDGTLLKHASLPNVNGVLLLESGYESVLGLVKKLAR